MSKAEFWQRGEALDYTNNTDATIPSNTLVQIGDHLGVTGTVIEPGQTGSLHVGGVWEIKKTGKAAISMGQTVYFDGEGITDAADSGEGIALQLEGGEEGGEEGGKEGETDADAVAYVEAGFAAADAAEDAETILVKLRG